MIYYFTNFIIVLIVASSAARPYLLSILNWEKSLVSVALRSPCVRAPRLSKRFATMDANRRSPAKSEMRNMYSGAFTWLERCVRPNCCIALSALHGNSRVMCTLRIWFLARLSLCSDIPLLAASEIMATVFSPSINLLIHKPINNLIFFALLSGSLFLQRIRSFEDKLIVRLPLFFGQIKRF